MSELSRRDFLRGTLATGVVASTPGWSRADQPPNDQIFRLIDGEWRRGPVPGA